MENIKVMTKCDEMHDVRFEYPIESVTVNGERLSNVHTLTKEVVRMTKTIKVLAITATTLALMAVLAIAWLASWLKSHESSIEELLLTSGDEYAELKRTSDSWKSQKRQRAFVTLHSVLGYRWNEETMDWEAPELVTNLSPKVVRPPR